MGYYGSFTATSQRGRLDPCVDKGPGKKKHVLWPKKVCHWQQALGRLWGIAPPVLAPNPLPWQLGLAIQKRLHVQF